jgi:hypothetical protein
MGVDPTSRTPSIPDRPSITPLMHTAVLLRQSRGTYVTQPTIVHPELMSAVLKINVEVAFTMMTEITKLIFDTLDSEQTDLLLPDGSQYQILDSVSAITTSASSEFKRFQYTCLLRRERMILIWHDDVQQILQHASDVERTLLTLVCDMITALLIQIGVSIADGTDLGRKHSPYPFRNEQSL